MKLQFLLWNEKPISIELPNNIECIIESTDAAIKNQTASSSYKPALLDCGIKIDVPPFIESGEKIVIDTRTLEYIKRVILMRLNSPQINIITKACMKASRSLIRDFGEIEKLQVSIKRSRGLCYISGQKNRKNINR